MLKNETSTFVHYRKKAECQGVAKGSVHTQVWAPSQQNGLTSECPEILLFLFGIVVGAWRVFLWFVLFNFTTKFALDQQNLLVIVKKIENIPPKKNVFCQELPFFSKKLF